MHAYQYKDTQVFTDNLQEEYLGEKSLGWFMGFFLLLFFKGRIEIWGWDLGQGLRRGSFCCYSELSARIFFTR